MACCSSHSINKLARIGDTGLPMAVPNFCLNNCPLKLKYVVMAQVISTPKTRAGGLYRVTLRAYHNN